MARLARWNAALVPLLAVVLWLCTVPTSAGVERVYYIAADEVLWNYAPLDWNEIRGAAINQMGSSSSFFFSNDESRIGSTYIKAKYRGYTDASFSVLQNITAEDEHLGILGPRIMCEVGDTVRVVFRNNLAMPSQIVPRGLQYPASDVTLAIPPGGTHTYVWQVPVRSGPGPDDPSSIGWLYGAELAGLDRGGGLLGPIVVTRQGHANPDGSPNDIDRQFSVVFEVNDENLQPYISRNYATFLVKDGRPEGPMVEDSNRKHTINGYSYGNLNGLVAYRYETVRWYVYAVGQTIDIHLVHWHANTELFGNIRTDVANLIPGSSQTLDSLAENPGLWLFHCHINDHIIAGMLALVRVIDVLEPNDVQHDADVDYFAQVLGGASTLLAPAFLATVMSALVSMAAMMVFTERRRY